MNVICNGHIRATVDDLKGVKWKIAGFPCLCMNFHFKSKKHSVYFSSKNDLRKWEIVCQIMSSNAKTGILNCLLDYYSVDLENPNCSNVW